jgi:hypothetical protein
VKNPRAFISAVTSELSEARGLVAKKLWEMGFDVDYQDDWGAMGGELLDILQKKVSSAQVFIQLVGSAPGVPPAMADSEFPDASFTQLEFHYARKTHKSTGKPVPYVFFVGSDVANKLAPPIVDADRRNQDAYKEALAKDGNLTFYGAPTIFDLIDKVTGIDHFRKLREAWHEDWERNDGPPLARPTDSSEEVRDFSLATSHYSSQWLPWQSRPNDEAALQRFLNDTRPFLWWVITGEGGVGKSRLAQELMLRKDNDAWAFGTLSPTHAWWDGHRWTPEGDILIVADYAASRRDWTDALFRVQLRAENRKPKGSTRVRVLLLTRPDGFTSFVRGNSTNESFRAVRGAAYVDSERADVSVEPNEAPGDERLIRRKDALYLAPAFSTLRSALLLVLKSIARGNPGLEEELTAVVPDDDHAAYWEKLKQKTAGGRWLLLQIYGWLLSLEKKREHKTDFEIAGDFEALLKAFLVREIRANWKPHRGPARTASEEDTDRIIAVLAIATLQRKLERKDFEKLPQVRRLKAKRRGILWRRCQGILGGDQNSNELPAVEPDLAGEALVLQALSTLGWDTDAPGEGHFVPGFDKKALLGTQSIVRRVLRNNRDGLAHFLGLIGRDFVSHNVTLNLFTFASQAALFDPTFVPTDNLLAALFDYGWGDYEDESSRPSKYADSLLQALERRTELQQYIYDSGIIPRYTSYLEGRVEAAHTMEPGSDVLSGVLSLKLLGHAVYRRNDPRGPALFENALTLIAKLEASGQALDGRAWLLPWYRVFFHDHHSNDLSKDDKLFPSDGGRYAVYQTHHQAAFDALPERLRTANQRPEPEDLPLLIRSAHFWGHVGNQETRILSAYFKSKATARDQVHEHLQKGRQAYFRAALFRLAGYKTSFFPQVANSGEHVAFIASVDKVLEHSANEGHWLPGFLADQFKEGLREHFLHPSQSLGDTAHQLIGASKLHYQTFALLRPQQEEAARAMSEADELFNAAMGLWAATKEVASQEGRALIQYYVWTVENELLQLTARASLDGGSAAVRALQIDEELMKRLGAVREAHKVAYEDAEKKVKTGVREFWNYLAQPEAEHAR